MTFLAGWPPLKRIIVGIESDLELRGGLLVLVDVELDDAQVVALGGDLLEHRGTTRHGPHQGAQKSTSTGVSDSMTSAWKLVSVTSVMCLPCRLLRCGGDQSLYKV